MHGRVTAPPALGDSPGASQSVATTALPSIGPRGALTRFSESSLATLCETWTRHMHSQYQERAQHSIAQKQFVRSVIELRHSFCETPQLVYYKKLSFAHSFHHL